LLALRLFPALLTLAVFGASVPDAAAASNSSNRGLIASSQWKFVLGAGTRYWSHYNRQRVTSTPEASILGEASVSVWYKRAVGIRLAFAKNIAQSSAQIISGGLDLPLLVMFQKGTGGPLLNSFIFALTGDFAMYSIAPPEVADAWETSGVIPRYGAKVVLGIKGSKLLLDVQVMVTKLNDNFWIAPYAGLGFVF
jgi:hypothetical protein